MIGKPEWFARRKYGGWGIRPKTWQGWVYILFMVVPIVLFNSMYMGAENIKLLVTGAWIFLILVDIFHIMYNLKKDELEKRIEAMSERNATYAMIAVIVVAILYQGIMTAMTGIMHIDYFLYAVLLAGVIAKGASNIYYERKGL